MESACTTAVSQPGNYTSDGAPPPGGSLDGEEENEGSESGLDLDGQGRPCRYASALCEEREDACEFEEEALRELEDSLQLMLSREEEALGELEDVLRLVREASDGTDHALTLAKQEELVKQLEDLDITWHCEGDNGDMVKVKGPAVLDALLSGKEFSRRRPQQPRNSRKGAQGTSKRQQTQKVKGKQRCANAAHACAEIGDSHWPQRRSRVRVEEAPVLTKPGMWPCSLFCCAA